MTQPTNALGQPIGFPLPAWTPPPMPPRDAMAGRTCTVLPLDPAVHAADLHAANILEPTERLFTYLFTEPFKEAAAYRAWTEQAAASTDTLFQAIVSRETGTAQGIAAFMRIDRPNGVIEVGHINYSPLLQQTIAATEAMYLMMARVFALGYRRYEWKCDSNNSPSKAAAARLGFTYEGRFRQAVVTKGRNRDTDWFSILDSEWPHLKKAFETWLDPGNFDAAGRQRQSLSALTKRAREEMATA
jgi:RimJ/RimL family protein N-acetyltransferase